MPLPSVIARGVVLAVSMMVSGGNFGPAQSTSAPEKRDDGWPASTAREVGFKEYLLDGFNSSSICRAAGNGDRNIFVLPEQPIIITINAGLYDQDHWVSGTILRETLFAYQGGRQGSWPASL